MWVGFVLWLKCDNLPKAPSVLPGRHTVNAAEILVSTLFAKWEFFCLQSKAALDRMATK